MNRSRQTAITNNRQRTGPAPLPRNVKLALKSMRRQENKTSVLVGGSADPPPIGNDIVVQKVVELTNASSPLSLKYSTVYQKLDPGATPFFTTMRVIKVSAWGPPTTSGGLPVVQVSVDYDGAFFTDHGQGTARAPNLHVRLPELIRETWVATNNTTEFAQVLGANVVVQVTIEVRANTSMDT